MVKPDMNDLINQQYILSPFPYKDIIFPVTVERFLSEWPIEHVLHWHEEVEFIYQLEGYGYFQVGAEILKLETGQALLINKEEYHCTFHPGFQSTGTIYCIGFKPEILSSGNKDVFEIKFIQPIVLKQWRLPTLIQGISDWETEVLAQLKTMVGYYIKKPYGYEFAIKSCIFSVFTHIILNNKLEHMDKNHVAAHSTKTERLKRILNYVHANYDKKISYKNILNEINMSEAYFCRFFKSMMGQTLIKYINQMRIRKASILLADKGRKIMDVALEAGFDSLSYFIKTFKQHKKCTPQEFRHSGEIQSSKKLPAGWNRKHIGLIAKPGSAYCKNGIFTLNGSGLDIWNTNDEFQFAYIKLEGDCKISAKITSIQNTDGSAKAGVMLRESLESDSRFAHVLLTPGFGVYFDARKETNAEAKNIANIPGITSPIYLELIRSGNYITSYFSDDGCQWAQLGHTVRLDMGVSAYAGLAVTSHSSNRLLEVICTATFEDVCATCEVG